MLKISQVNCAGRAVTLRLEGRIVGPWVAELDAICGRLLAEDGPLNLCLTDVEFVDAQGLALLVHFRSRGVLFSDASPFIAEQLKVMEE